MAECLDFSARLKTDKRPAEGNDLGKTLTKPWRVACLSNEHYALVQLEAY
jgi:hypothetical protein